YAGAAPASAWASRMTSGHAGSGREAASATARGGSRRRGPCPERLVYTRRMAMCPSCKTRYSGGALLCRNCGQPVPPADIAEADIAEADIAEAAFGPGDPTPNVAANALRICPRCGRVVPTRQKTCRVCRDDPPEPVEVV